VVLAAGGGTRMKSATPKVLHRMGGRSLLGHAMAAARGVGPDRVVVVVRQGDAGVAAEVVALDPDAVVAEQDDVPGTGRAAECGLAVLPPDLDAVVLITMGDAPLLTAETLRELAAQHAQGGRQVTMLTAERSDPAGYGRVIRDEKQAVVGIVEHADATPEQLGVSEVNAGCYAFELATLRRVLGRLDDDNAQGERYLTDAVAAVLAEGGSVGTFQAADAWHIEGVNDRVQLAALGAELNRRVLEHWMSAGVTIVDARTTWIDVDVRLGRDVTIHPHTQILGVSSVEDDVTLGPDTTLTDVHVARGATVVRTHAVGATIGAGASVGPFAYVRPGTWLGADGKIGCFVETKNARIASGAKVPHLSYVGDADVGAGTNIGAGTIFANYDGMAKHRTSVGEECRTGANNTFVAPVVIGDGAVTGAGTVVRRDVPPGALAVSTGPQRHIADWVRRKRAGTKAARAAERATAAGSEEEQ
jgi:bifunctional UDP-N-acetylglucosamine pyrophosphorylase/glucosamine-1-phosphate N-acetyltransferase